MSKNNKTTPNVPTLRFPEFSDLWTQKSFNETFDVLSNNTLSRAELNYTNGEYKNIHYGDILIKFPAHTDVTSVIVPYINNESSSAKHNGTLLQNGDIVFADTAEDYAVGKATEIENVTTNKVVSGLHTIPCRPRIKFYPRYLGYFLNSPKYHNQLIPYIQGVKVSSISKTLIKNTTISYPSLTEQTKIAKLISFLDEKIETQNKIISKYESLIKGISKHIVHIACGKTITFKEVSSIYQPVTITQAELDENGQYPVYGANGIIGHYNNYNHENSQIIITCRGSTCGTVNISEPFSWITGNSMVINVDKFEDKIDKMYLYYYLKTISFRDLISGSGQPQIVRKPLLDLIVLLPELEVQKYYRLIISKIAEKLENEKEMLSALQRQKAFLLKAMFI